MVVLGEEHHALSHATMRDQRAGRMMNSTLRLPLEVLGNEVAADADETLDGIQGVPLALARHLRKT